LHNKCLLKHVIEGKVDRRMGGRRGRRRKQLPDDVNEQGRYRKLKEESVDHTNCRTSIGRYYGPYHNTDYTMMKRTAVTTVVEKYDRTHQ